MAQRSILNRLGFGNLVPRAGNRYYTGPTSNHFNGTNFFNPGGIAPRGLTDLLKWKFAETAAKWPASFPTPFPQAVPQDRVGGDGLRVTMVGHATLLIQIAGLNILTDPVWSERASPFSAIGPKRVNAPGIRFEDLPPIDLILLSHNHYDHMDMATLKRLKTAHNPQVITPLGNDAIVKKALPDIRIAAHDWGDAVKLGEATIHLEPAHHWSARGLGDRRAALWAGFVIETPAGKIYHIGDTGFHGGANYKAAAAKHGGFRLAILPIGAYDPRWFMEAQHQNPDEAVQGMKLCNAAHVAGHHWATFQLTNEPIDEPREKLSAALAAQDISPDRFRPMLAGEVWDVPAS